MPGLSTVETLTHPQKKYDHLTAQPNQQSLTTPVHNKTLHIHKSTEKSNSYIYNKVELPEVPQQKKHT
jgi:hypothetical protein